MDQQNETTKTLCRMFFLGECEQNFGIRLEMGSLGIPYHPPMCLPFKSEVRLLVNTSSSHELKNIFSDMYLSLGTRVQFEIGHPMQGSIIQCTLGGKPCNTSEFYQFSSFQYGNCFIVKNESSVIYPY